MGLIHNQHFPVDGAERGRVDADQFVRCEQDVELNLTVLPHLERLAASSDRSLLKRKLMLSANGDDNKINILLGNDSSTTWIQCERGGQLYF